MEPTLAQLVEKARRSPLHPLLINGGSSSAPLSTRDSRPFSDAVKPISGSRPNRKPSVVKQLFQTSSRIIINSEKEDPSPAFDYPLSPTLLHALYMIYCLTIVHSNYDLDRESLSHTDPDLFIDRKRKLDALFRLDHLQRSEWCSYRLSNKGWDYILKIQKSYLNSLKEKFKW